MSFIICINRLWHGAKCWRNTNANHGCVDQATILVGNRFSLYANSIESTLPEIVLSQGKR